MDWTEAIGKAITFIEEHIMEDLSVGEIAKQVCISPFYFQKGFSLLCGFTVSEYIRKRRLALAGAELVSTDVKVIDAALKYGYDSPDSFTKAFTRFHGITPGMVRKERHASGLCTIENQSNIERRLSYGLQNHAKGQLHCRWGIENVSVSECA